ncbi:unnamed protein product [Urochloa humidicola]
MIPNKRGQVRLQDTSQRSTQSRWKTCRHGSRRVASLARILDRQTRHSSAGQTPPPLSPACIASDLALMHSILEM